MYLIYLMYLGGCRGVLGRVWRRLTCLWRSEYAIVATIIMSSVIWLFCIIICGGQSTPLLLPSSCLQSFGCFASSFVEVRVRHCCYHHHVFSHLVVLHHHLWRSEYAIVATIIMSSVIWLFCIIICGGP